MQYFFVKVDMVFIDWYVNVDVTQFGELFVYFARVSSCNQKKKKMRKRFGKSTQIR